MITKEKPREDLQFLDMQAALGISKHIGGYKATDELLALCHIEQAREVLNVGCGTGVGSIYIARKYGCHVAGVDLSEKMVAWSLKRAREAKVGNLAEFRTADVLDLPFDANRFDVVFAESVLIFIEDKARAIRECMRVAKPGGYIGLNEGLWFKQPSPDLLRRVGVAVGPCVPTLDEWQALWEASGLQERVVQIHQVDAKTELKSRVQWIGWRWLVPAWGRALRLYITNPAIRKSIQDVFDVPPEAMKYLGYGLFVGRK